MSTCQRRSLDCTAESREGQRSRACRAPLSGMPLFPCAYCLETSLQPRAGVVIKALRAFNNGARSQWLTFVVILTAAAVLAWPPHEPCYGQAKANDRIYRGIYSNPIFGYSVAALLLPYTGGSAMTRAPVEPFISYKALLDAPVRFDKRLAVAVGSLTFRDGTSIVIVRTRLAGRTPLSCLPQRSLDNPPNWDARPLQWTSRRDSRCISGSFRPGMSARQDCYELCRSLTPCLRDIRAYLQI